MDETEDVLNDELKRAIRGEMEELHGFLRDRHGRFTDIDEMTCKLSKERCGQPITEFWNTPTFAELPPETRSG